MTEAKATIPEAGPTGERPTPDRFVVALMTMCVAFAAVTLILARQNWQLRDRIERNAATTLVRGPLRVGDNVGRVTILMGPGDKRYLEIPVGGYAAIFAHVRDCEACVAAAEGWREAIERLGPNVLPVALSLDAPGRIEFRARQTYGLEIFGLVSADESPLSRVPVAPTVVLIDERWVVRAMWPGVGDPAAGAAAWRELVEIASGASAGRPAKDID